MQSHSDIFVNMTDYNEFKDTLHDMSAYRTESDGHIIHATGYLGHMSYSKHGETLNAYRCSTHDENLLIDMITRASMNYDMLSLLNIVIDSDFTDLTQYRDDDIMLPISFIANWMYELFSHDLTERMLETMFNEPAVNHRPIDMIRTGKREQFINAYIVLIDDINENYPFEYAMEHMKAVFAC